MLIYSHSIQPRLKYILKFFAEQISGEEWQITTSKEDFTASTDVKINYSTEPIDTICLHVMPHTLLSEKNVRPQEISCSEIDGVKVFFQNNSETGFDIFSAAFYLLSRYEEYLPHEKDKYGRFSHENSLAFKEAFLKQPLVDIWIERFKFMIAQKFPRYQFKQKAFTFLPTYDIDMAWSYLHKGVLRNSFNLTKDLLALNFSALKERLNVLRGKEKDLFYTFDWLADLHKQYKLDPLYFFLVAEKLSEKDKNISPHHPAMQKLIADISGKYQTGLHPSWRSSSDETILKSEKKILESIIKKPVVASRQHYLKLSIPMTYRKLIAADIEADYTMGYSADNGFRASAASPFKWYDLEKDEETGLTIYPFCFMDVTSAFYKKQTPQETSFELQTFYNEVKKVNGLFSMLWHNSSFTNKNEFEGWQEMYKSFLKRVC